MNTPIYSGINDVNGQPINDGDSLHVACQDGKKILKLYLPVFFDNGAFWVDKSDKRDQSEAVLLCEFPLPLRKTTL